MMPNPLRLLRSLLSEDETPMSQLKFAHVVDVPVSTIKAIEKGQRTFSPYVRENVALATGAGWRKQREQWMYLLPKQERPYDFSCYLEFSEIMTKRPSSDVRDFQGQFARLIKLSKQYPDQYWRGLFFKFQSFIDDRETELVELRRQAGVASRR